MSSGSLRSAGPPRTSGGSRRRGPAYLVAKALPRRSTSTSIVSVPAGGTSASSCAAASAATTARPIARSISSRYAAGRPSATQSSSENLRTDSAVGAFRGPSSRRPRRLHPRAVDVEPHRDEPLRRRRERHPRRLVERLADQVGGHRRPRHRRRRRLPARKRRGRARHRRGHGRRGVHLVTCSGAQRRGDDRSDARPARDLASAPRSRSRKPRLLRRSPSDARR